MKKLILLIALMTALLDCDLSFSQAPSWKDVGTTGFSVGTGLGLNHRQSLAFNALGTPYVAYKDASKGDRATVMSFNGVAWEVVGPPGLSPGKIDYPSLAFDGLGRPYLAYLDYFNDSKTTVMRFNGVSWETVGNAGISLGYAEYQSLAIDASGTPYVAYQDKPKNSAATVKKFNGTTWETVGIEAFAKGTTSFHSLVIDASGTPYLAYRDSPNGYKASVMKFNGTSWQPVGTVGFSAGNSYFQSLAIDPSGALYMAYRDDVNGLKTTVKKFNGTSWITVGTVGFTAGQAHDQSLAIDASGRIYVAFRDDTNSSKTTVMSFNGSSWEIIGTEGFSAGSSKIQSLAIDLSGNPYVSYMDEGTNKIGVMRFVTTPELNTTEASSITTVSADLGGTISLDNDSAVTERGIVYSITAINANPLIGGTGTTINTNGSGIGVFNETITGLITDTSYSFRAYAKNGNGTGYGVIKTFNTGDILGLDMISLKNRVSVSPNPVVDKLFIKADGLIIDNITVVDVLGKTILNVRPLNGVIDLSPLNTGVYILNIITNQGNLAKRIIK